MGRGKKLLFVALLIFFIVKMMSFTPFGIERAVEKAEKLSDRGDYVAAWRLLYDTLRKEHLLGPLELMGLYDGGKAADALDRLEWTLLHDEQSALMQILRDPARSILDKRKMVSELVNAAEENTIAPGSFLQDHDDPFVRVLTSKKLTANEKIELLIRIRRLVENHYVFSLQRDELLEQVSQFETVIREQLHQGHYEEAFRLLHEIEDIADLFSYADHDMIPLIQEAVDTYLRSDNTPLTKLLRNPNVSFFDKRTVLMKLQELLRYPDAFQEIDIRGERYTGSFIELLPEFNYPTRSLIWGNLKGFLERNEIYLEDEITRDLVQAAFPHHEYLPIFPQGMSFQQLQVEYRRDYVRVSLQGTVSLQHLQTFYASLGFTPQMFTSQITNTDKSMLAQYWNVALKEVQFARLIIEKSEETPGGEFVFAYQADEQGKVQFYLLFMS